MGTQTAVIPEARERARAYTHIHTHAKGSLSAVPEILILIPESCLLNIQEKLPVLGGWNSEQLTFCAFAFLSAKWGHSQHLPH